MQNSIYEEKQDFYILYLHGELSLGTEKHFLSIVEELQIKMDKPLYLDIRHLKFIDSTGLGLILYIMKQRAQSSSTLRVINASAKMQRLFNVTGIAKFIQ